MHRLLKRLREPSTYAGLGLLAAALGWDAEWQALVQAVIAMAGFLALVLPEESA